MVFDVAHAFAWRLPLACSVGIHAGVEFFSRRKNVKMNLDTAR